MKKKWFDSSLYKEELKQLRVMGWMFFIILSIAAILIPLGYAVNSSPETNLYISYPMQMQALNVHPLLIICLPVVAPCLTLYAFHFLNKRNASDFYHSIPQSRTCIYVSIILAVITWLLVIIAGTTGISVLLCTLCSKYLAINMASVLALMFQVFAGSVFVTACISAAMSVTGTVFSNIVVSLLLIFMPRLLTLMMTTCIGSALPYIPTGRFLSLLDYSYNVVTGFVFNFFLGESISLLYDYGSGAYTLVIAVLYLLLGGFLFKKRKSESAGYAALNSRLQTVIRLTVALVICLIPIAILFFVLAGTEAISSSTLFTVVVFYILALIAYFLYELISTKKWKNIMKAIPGLGILAVVNVVLVLSMFGIYSYHASIRPDAEEITSINILADGSAYWSSGWVSGWGDVRSESYDYFDSLIEEISLSSPEIKSMIATRLETTIEYWESDDEYVYPNYKAIKTFAIHTGNKTIYRNIQLQKADLELLMKALAENKALRDSYTNLPEIDGSNTVLSQFGDLNSEAGARVYQVFRQEIQEIGFEKWYEIRQNALDGSANLAGILYLQHYRGTKLYTAELYITREMPKTYNQFMQESINLNMEKRLKAVEVLSNSEIEMVDRWLQLVRPESTGAAASGNAGSYWEVLTYGHDAYNNEISKSTRDELGKALQAVADQVPNAEQSILQMTIDWYGEDGRYDSYTGFFALELEDLPEEIQTNLTEY